MNIVVLYEKNDYEIMFDNKTLFVKTLIRFKYFLLEINRYIIVCKEEDYLIVQEQIKELNFNKDYTIIIEPMGKGTIASVITGVLACDRIYTSLVVSCDYIFDDKDWDSTLKFVDETSIYALTGAIYSQNRYILEKSMSKLKNCAGNFYINDKPTGAVVGQQPFGGARASGTNDKAGSSYNLIRWTSPRLIKETFVPEENYRYPFLE